MAEHSKDNCRQDISWQDVRFVQTKCFYDLCLEHGEHTTKYCPFNMKNGKASWCKICETKNHNTSDCHLNLKNRQNYQAVYQMNIVAQNNEQRNNAQNDQNNQRYEGRRYEHRFKNRRGGYGSRGWFSGNHDNRPHRPMQCFTCYKEGHPYADCPYKDRTDLKFCISCGVSDHS